MPAAINGAIIMLVEAKARGQKAEAHDGQIQYYFASASSEQRLVLSLTVASTAFYRSRAYQ